MFNSAKSFIVAIFITATFLVGPFYPELYISVDPDETHKKLHEFYEAEHPVTTFIQEISNRTH